MRLLVCAFFLVQYVPVHEAVLDADVSQARVEAFSEYADQYIGYKMRDRVREYCERAIRVEGLSWDAEHVEAMVEIAYRESRFDPSCQNPESTAYGMWQFLDSTWSRIPKTDDPFLQTVAAVRYIEARYGDPVKALDFHYKRGYY